MRGEAEPNRRHGDGAPHRRAWVWLVGDHRPRENRYRDVLLLLAFGVALWGVWTATEATGTASRATDDAHHAIVRVQEGRATSITITCAMLSAVSQAGQAVITGASTGVAPPLAAFLERHGYPPAKVRQAQAAVAARGYVADIDRRVRRELRQVGKRTPAGLIRKDGTLDCKVLQRVSAVPNPR